MRMEQHLGRCPVGVRHDFARRDGFMDRPSAGDYSESLGVHELRNERVRGEHFAKGECGHPGPVVES